MGEIAYLNGMWMKPAEATVPAEDRGNVFGDGVYEAAAAYEGRIWALERHLRRLARSLRELDIRGVDVAKVGEVMAEGVKRSGIPESMIYLQITRGAAPRDHDWKAGLQPTFFLTVRERHDCKGQQYKTGVAVITVSEIRWGRCDIKSLNLLPNVMAYHQAVSAGAYEAVFVRDDGVVTECSKTGLFIVRDGEAITREDGPHILPSVTQGLVLEIARDLGIPAKRRPFTKSEMMEADEVFLAGTTPMVLGVTRIDGRAVGGGVVGEISKRLLAGYMDRRRRLDDAPRDQQ